MYCKSFGLFFPCAEVLNQLPLFLCAGLVQDSINRCDPDLRRDLYNGVLLAGPQRFAIKLL